MIQRYEFFSQDDFGPSDNGDYVLYEDYKSERDSLASELAAEHERANMALALAEKAEYERDAALEMHDEELRAAETAPVAAPKFPLGAMPPDNVGPDGKPQAAPVAAPCAGCAAARELLEMHKSPLNGEAGYARELRFQRDRDAWLKEHP